jgi:hypothetical protein
MMCLDSGFASILALACCVQNAEPALVADALAMVAYTVALLRRTSLSST